MTSRTLKTVLAALGAMLFAATAYAQETIKIGVTQPLTGAFAASGNYVAQGAKIAEDEINNAGGVLGKKIQLIIEDNKSNPTEAVGTVEKLIHADKVPVLIGAWSSTLTLAVMPKLEEYKVPMMVETSSSGKITTSGNPYIFRISPTSEMEAVAFRRSSKRSASRKADFLSTNNDFGIGSADEYSEDAERATASPSASWKRWTRRRLTSPRSLPRSRPRAATRCSSRPRVEQLTLILKQAKEQQAEGPHHHDRRLGLARSADRAGRRRSQRLATTWCSSRPGSPTRSRTRMSPSATWTMEQAKLQRRRADRGFPRL